MEDVKRERIFKLFDNEVHANIGTDCQSVKYQNVFKTNDCCCLQFLNVVRFFHKEINI